MSISDLFERYTKHRKETQMFFDTITIGDENWSDEVSLKKYQSKLMNDYKKGKIKDKAFKIRANEILDGIKTSYDNSTVSTNDVIKSTKSSAFLNLLSTKSTANLEINDIYTRNDFNFEQKKQLQKTTIDKFPYTVKSKRNHVNGESFYPYTLRHFTFQNYIHNNRFIKNDNFYEDLVYNYFPSDNDNFLEQMFYRIDPEGSLRPISMRDDSNGWIHIDYNLEDKTRSRVPEPLLKDIIQKVKEWSITTSDDIHFTASQKNKIAAKIINSTYKNNPTNEYLEALINLDILESSGDTEDKIKDFTLSFTEKWNTIPKDKFDIYFKNPIAFTILMKMFRDNNIKLDCDGLKFMSNPYYTHKLQFSNSDKIRFDTSSLFKRDVIKKAVSSLKYHRSRGECL